MPFTRRLSPVPLGRGLLTSLRADAEAAARSRAARSRCRRLRGRSLTLGTRTGRPVRAVRP
jgi:hypothetical protein